MLLTPLSLNTSNSPPFSPLFPPNTSLYSPTFLSKHLSILSSFNRHPYYTPLHNERLLFCSYHHPCFSPCNPPFHTPFSLKCSGLVSVSVDSSPNMSKIQSFSHMATNSNDGGDGDDAVGSGSGTAGDEMFEDGGDSDCEVVRDDDDVGDDGGFGHAERWDVLGLGQAMVDFSGVVDDEFLKTLALEKGTRKLVNHEERGKVLRAMDGCSYKAAAGGSLSNSLVALARLGIQPAGGPVLNVAMAGSIGSDPLGGFYRTKLRRASVNFLSAPVKDGTTGTVIVLTTPDAQRTMLAYQGTSSKLNYDPCLATAISKTNILVVEGYLFELPDTIKTITKACKDARSSGALVAVTASDVFCIERHYDDFWKIIANYADIVFANSDEARALCNFSPKETTVCSTRYLSHFVPLVSVTEGPRGSYIGVRGESVYIPPSPCVPVDTCGAGDAYASGILYGILRGVSDLKEMGSLASRVAAVVVGQQGTRLRVQDAVELAESFAFHVENSANLT